MVTTVLCFSGQRNQSHFKMLNDPQLSTIFAPNFCWDISHFTSELEQLRMMKLLREKNPNIILGYYHSACTALPVAKDPVDDFYYPHKLHIEDIPSETWYLHNADGSRVCYTDSYRPFLDLRKIEVRTAIISTAVFRAKTYKFDAVSFDNCYYQYGMPPENPTVVSANEWTLAYQSFYQEAGSACHAVGLKCIVNIASNADLIGEAFDVASQYVDGVMSEAAFHPNIRTEPWLTKELQGYENVLKRGKMVFLFTAKTEDESFGLAQIAPLSKKYGNIYLTATGPVKYNSLYILETSSSSSSSSATLSWKYPHSAKCSRGSLIGDISNIYTNNGAYQHIIEVATGGIECSYLFNNIIDQSIKLIVRGWYNGSGIAKIYIKNQVNLNYESLTKNIFDFPIKGTGNVNFSFSLPLPLKNYLTFDNKLEIQVRSTGTDISRGYHFDSFILMTGSSSSSKSSVSSSSKSSESSSSKSSESSSSGSSSSSSDTIGFSGTSGTSGSSGLSGRDGSSGSSGYSGSSGTSGSSGSTGTSGSSGSSGSSGETGLIGLPGSSGTSGSSGKNGTSGSSGSSGKSGLHGTSGTSGSSPNINLDVLIFHLESIVLELKKANNSIENPSII